MNRCRDRMDPNYDRCCQALPPEPCNLKRRRVKNEINNANLRRELIIKHTKEIYSYPVSLQNKRELDKCFKTLKQIYRARKKSVISHFDHVIKVTSKGSMIVQSKIHGDTIPEEYYRMTALSTWRAYRYYHHSVDLKSIPDPKHAFGFRHIPDDESIPKQSLSGYFKKGKRHDDHHLEIQKWNPALAQDAYKEFLKCMINVIKSTVQKNAEKMGKLQISVIPFVIPIDNTNFMINIRKKAFTKRSHPGTKYTTCIIDKSKATSYVEKMARTTVETMQNNNSKTSVKSSHSKIATTVTVNSLLIESEANCNFLQRSEMNIQDSEKTMGQEQEEIDRNKIIEQGDKNKISEQGDKNKISEQGDKNKISEQGDKDKINEQGDNKLHKSQEKGTVKNLKKK